MTIGAINPIENPEAWDTIVIAGVKCPGICKVGETKRPYEWDVKVGGGTLGATTTFKGKPPAEYSVQFLLWAPEHFHAWDSFLPLFQYDPSRKTLKAFDVYHPKLAELGIHSCVAKSIGSIEHDGDGLYSRTIEILEYFPAPKVPAIATPSTSESIVEPGTATDPAVVAAQKGLDAALADAKALGPITPGT